MDNGKPDDINSSTALTTDPVPDPPQKPKRILAAALAVMIVLGGAAGIYFGTSGKGEDPEPVDEMSLYDPDEPVIGCLEIADVDIAIKTGPSADDPMAGRSIYFGESVNVYEILSQNGQEWYRIGLDRWIRERDGVIYHAGEEASAYPYEKAFAGTYRYENTVIRLKDDGSCILRDTAGTYAESTGGYTCWGGNVYLTFDSDSPVLYYARQNGLDTGPAKLFVVEPGMLAYMGGGSLYDTGYSAVFAKEEGSSGDVYDPETLIDKYFEAVMNCDEEAIRKLHSEEWVEINGGWEEYREYYDPAFAGLMGDGIQRFRTTDCYSPEYIEAVCFEVKAVLEASGMDNVSDVTGIGIEAVFDGCGTVDMLFVFAEIDGQYRIVMINA